MRRTGAHEAADLLEYARPVSRVERRIVDVADERRELLRFGHRHLRAHACRIAANGSIVLPCAASVARCSRRPAPKKRAAARAALSGSPGRAARGRPTMTRHCRETTAGVGWMSLPAM